jgi:hypothetical protein
MSQRESGYERKPLDQYETPVGDAGANPATARVRWQDLGASMRQRQDGRRAYGKPVSRWFAISPLAR